MAGVSWNVLITARTMNEVGKAAIRALTDAGCQVRWPPKLGPLRAAELIPVLDGIDAVLASMDDYGEPVFQAAPRLKIVSRWGVGYDAIDVPAATRAGVIIAYTPGMLDEAVADLAFGLLLTLARRLHESHRLMTEGAWTPLWGRDVHGKVLGIVGCGRIGRAVARRARGFDMRVLGYDVQPPPEAAALGVAQVGLDELLAQSDFVSIHAALTNDNRGLIGEAALRRMRPTAYLINAARGGLVDQAALERALREGRIAGAALDVFAEEPLPASHSLRTAPNVLLTPHQASFARDTGERVSLAAAEAIIDALQTRRPKNVVNQDVFTSPALRTPVQP